MVIKRNNFDHDPPWKYTIMERRLFPSTGLNSAWPKEYYLPMTNPRLKETGYLFWWICGWTMAWGGSRWGGKRYKTISDALQALKDIKQNEEVYDARIHHIYYEP